MQTAKKYLEAGSFYWNAGIFVWKVQTLIDELQNRLPTSINQLSHLLENHHTTINDVPWTQIEKTYSQLPKISIDHAVLELSENVAVIRADIGWQDVGSWDALAQCFPTDPQNNFLAGDVLTIDSQNSTIDTDGPFSPV